MYVFLDSLLVIKVDEEKVYTIFFLDNAFMKYLHYVARRRNSWITFDSVSNFRITK